MDQTFDLIIHGTWLKQKSDEPGWFHIWGEQRSPETFGKKTRGRLSKTQAHPYAVSSETAIDIFHTLAEAIMLDRFEPDISEGEVILTLPSVGKIPLPSRRSIFELEGEIKTSDYKVNSIFLPIADAAKFLSAIPRQIHDLPCGIGADIRFWSAAAKFAFHLIAQHRFIPILREEKNGEFTALWEPVMEDSSDIEKLIMLTRTMPDACRSVKSAIIDLKNKKSEIQCDLAESHPRQLILDFLNNCVDKWVRIYGKKKAISKGLKDESIIRWLTALMEPTGRFQPSADLKSNLKELCKSLADWRSSGIISRAPTETFRSCFRLEPPEDEGKTWTLRYFLQSLNDPSLLVPADVIWRERKSTLKYQNMNLDSPQEQLLTGLGKSSRIFPPVERSLRQARPETCSLITEEAYQFLSESSLLLQQSGFGVLAPPWWTEKKSQIKAKLRVSAPRVEGTGILSLDSILTYDWQLALGDEVITPEELERLAKLKVPLVQMRGQWVILRPEDIKSAIEFFNKHGESENISLIDTIHLSLSDTPELKGIKVETVETPDWFNSFINDLKNGTMKQIKQPGNFVGKLRPYQLDGLSWLAFMRQWGFGSCLADDMGLGKTIQVIAFMLNEKKLKKKKSVPNLLICPTSVVGNWQREIVRFAPPLKVMVHHGGDRLSGEEFSKSIMEYDLVVTSYGLARRDADDLAAVNWKGVMLDEAQNIKNPSSRIAQIVRKLKSEYRFTLTGTPVENRLLELWSIMEFLNPGYLGSQNAFNQRFVIPIERYGDERATKDLKALVAPFIMRRLKTDPKIIDDLPEKLEMKVYCNLTREQVTLYEAIVKDMMQVLNEDTERSDMKRRGMILSGLMKLKQLCNHPALFLHDHSELDGRSGKLQRLVEMFEEVLSEGDKALIFTQFTEMGEALQKYLSGKFQCDTLFLHGGVPQKKRDQMVSMFQEDPDGPPIFVISIRAGGTGLNLTRANHVFHFDRWWNPAVEDQATDRTFRIGQTRKVQVHKFVCTGTLEEQIDQLIEKKKSLAQSIIGSGEDWLTEISNNELQKMITLRRDAVFADER